MNDAQVLGVQRRGLARPQRGLHQHLDRGERVAHLVGDAGRELAQRGELVGPQQLALVLLHAFRHLLDALHQRLHLPVERVKVVAGHADGSHVAVQVLGHVLDAHAEPIHGSTQAARHAVAGDQPPIGPARPISSIAQPGLLADAEALAHGRLPSASC